MDEIDPVRAFRREQAVPNPVAREAARARLVAHIDADRASRDTASGPSHVSAANRDPGARKRVLATSSEQLRAFCELCRRASRLVVRSSIRGRRPIRRGGVAGLLEACARHRHVIRRLLTLSMRDKLTLIPGMSANDYLAVLGDAISHSDSWAGIQRKPLDWFARDAGTTYLEHLRHREMRSKLRIFILDAGEDADRMRADVQDRAALERYWQLTGDDVESYWIATDELTHALAWVRETGVPGDCALYDDRLLIGYDEGQRLLSFDLVDDNTLVSRICSELQSQLEHTSPGPFKAIPRSGVV